MNCASVATAHPKSLKHPLEVSLLSTHFKNFRETLWVPLPTSSKGNRYILEVTDLFTKWVEAFSLCSTESTVLATVLVDEIVCHYGVPVVIHSNQGANLTSSAIQHLCLLLGMEHTRATTYHPQGNGRAERFKRTLEAMLAKVVQANQQDWDTHLPEVLLAYCTAIHESTPYHMTFGRSPMLPMDVMLGWHPLKLVEEGEVVKLPQFVEETHQCFNDAYETVHSNLKQTHQWHLTRRNMGRPSKWGIEFGCILRQLKKVAARNWLPNGVVPILLWTRPALSTAVSNLLELHTK